MNRHQFSRYLLYILTVSASFGEMQGLGAPVAPYAVTGTSFLSSSDIDISTLSPNKLVDFAFAPSIGEEVEFKFIAIDQNRFVLNVEDIANEKSSFVFSSRDGILLSTNSSPLKEYESPSLALKVLLNYNQNLGREFLNLYFCNFHFPCSDEDIKAPVVVSKDNMKLKIRYISYQAGTKYYIYEEASDFPFLMVTSIENLDPSIEKLKANMRKKLEKDYPNLDANTIEKILEKSFSAELKLKLEQASKELGDSNSIFVERIRQIALPEAISFWENFTGD